VKANRGQLVAAALTLCQAWVAAGRPDGKEVLGMFDSWAAVIGGILCAAGVPGLLTNAKKFRQSFADQQSEWREFISLWWQRHGQNLVGVKDLFEWVESEQLLGQILDSENPRGRQTQLGKQLRKMRGRVIGDYRIDDLDKEDHSDRQLYRLEKVAKPASAMPETPPPADEEQVEMEA
jgi:hypothetical protein